MIARRVTSCGFALISFAIASLICMGCGSSSHRTNATAEAIRVKALPPLPPGAEPRTVAIQPFTMSKLITIAPELNLSTNDLCDLITERTKKEFVGSQQFQVVQAGQPADYILRGEIAELMVGPEIDTAGGVSIFSKGSNGSGDEQSKLRPLDVFIECELVDARTNLAVLRGKGAAKRDVFLSRVVNGNGDYNNTGGAANSFMAGYRFEPQHLQRVFLTAANELAVDVGTQANTLIFNPQAQARRAASTGESAGVMTPRTE